MTKHSSESEPRPQPGPVRKKLPDDIAEKVTEQIVIARAGIDRFAARLKGSKTTAYTETLAYYKDVSAGLMEALGTAEQMLHDPFSVSEPQYGRMMGRFSQKELGGHVGNLQSSMWRDRGKSATLENQDAIADEPHAADQNLSKIVSAVGAISGYFQQVMGSAETMPPGIHLPGPRRDHR